MERERYAQARERVLFHYSDGKMCCSNCRYDDIKALTIDHLDNNEARHRKDRTWANIFIYLERNDYPNGYQVLCMNCNWIKHLAHSKL